MSKTVYVIKKTLYHHGRPKHIFVTDGSSEVLEIPHKNIADKMTEVFNDNTDNGCSYEVIPILGNKNQ